MGGISIIAIGVRRFSPAGIRRYAIDKVEPRKNNVIVK